MCSSDIFIYQELKKNKNITSHQCIMVRQISEQRMQDKSNTNTDFKDYTTDSVKCNNKNRLFPCGPDKQGDIKRRANLKKSIYQDFTDVSFLGIGYFKALFYCK